MKIQLTNDEFYEIKIPEQINISDFRNIVAKFNFLLKNFAKFDVGSGEDIIISNKKLIGSNRTKYSEKWKFLRDNRDVVLEILNTYYHKSNEEFEEVLKKHNLNLQRKEISCSQFIRLREIHKIKSSEVGLSQFPNRYNQLSNIILKGGENEQSTNKEQI